MPRCLGGWQGLQHIYLMHVQEPLDTVVGYFGMRKISVAPLPNTGPMFIHLNNKPIVQVGLLDQVCSCTFFLGCSINRLSYLEIDS